MVSSDSRRASQTRKTAATYAARQTASTPMTTEVALTQLCHGSPASPPAGTRPDTTAPTTVPRQYGTSPEDSANAAPKFRRSRVRKTAFRNANEAPRSTMPTAASVRGTKSVSMIDAYASGKQVQSTTKLKTSQTWL